MIDFLPPRGVGIEPATLWLRAACQTTELSLSSPPSSTPPFVIFHFSLVTMKVHIKDDNFLTPAFLPHLDPFQFIFGQTNRCYGGSGPFGTFLDPFFDVKSVHLDKNEISARYIF